MSTVSHSAAVYNTSASFLHQAASVQARHLKWSGAKNVWCYLEGCQKQQGGLPLLLQVRQQNCKIQRKFHNKLSYRKQIVCQQHTQSSNNNFQGVRGVFNGGRSVWDIGGGSCYQKHKFHGGLVFHGEETFVSDTVGFNCINRAIIF